MDGFKIVITTIIVIAIVGFLGFLAKVALFPADTAMKSVDMAYEVTDKVLDADNAIYNYEWFIQQKQDIEALYKKEVTAQAAYDDYLAMLPTNKDDWERADRSELSRLKTVVTGIRFQTDDAIAEYNAKSAMTTRNIFKDNLPSNITRALISGHRLTN